MQRIHPVALGVAIGVLEGGVIFAVTVVLVLQGDFGPAFLSRLFPFYDISWRGAFLGLGEGFVDGFVGGLVLAWVYNAAARWLQRGRDVG